jgi:hypothetical protein
VAELCCERYARKPDNKADDECGRYMAETSNKRGSSGLAPGPSLLSCDKRDRDPMIRHNRVKNSDADYSANQ